MRGYSLRLMSPSRGVDMTQQQIPASICYRWLRVRAAALVLLGTILAMVSAATGQTFRVLHNFTGGVDGATPQAGLITDNGTHLYGTTSVGASGFGTAFRLTKTGSNFIFNPLYTFTGGGDGGSPMAALTIGPDGALYGTAAYGGNVNLCGEPFWTGCGVVFELRPPATPPPNFFSPWTESVLYAFSFTDGALPFSEVIFDSSGNMFGTTWGGGSVQRRLPPGSGEDCDYHCGVAYRLTKNGSTWQQTALYLFTEYEGSNPMAGLVWDHQQTHLYGANSYTGPAGYGTIFELTPSASGFDESTVHSFDQNDGGPVYSTLVIDSAGTLYGGNPGNNFLQYVYDGTAFSITTQGVLTELYSFSPADGPYGGLTLDASGNLYGTTQIGGANNHGSVFKLTRNGGGWSYTTLHDFTGSDGSDPTGKVLLDANGNLYGTASRGGANGFGTVWEITP